MRTQKASVQLFLMRDAVFGGAIDVLPPMVHGSEEGTARCGISSAILDVTLVVKNAAKRKAISPYKASITETP